MMMADVRGFVSADYKRCEQLRHLEIIKAQNGYFKAEAESFMKVAKAADIRSSKEKKEPKKRKLVTLVAEFALDLLSVMTFGHRRQTINYK